MTTLTQRGKHVLRHPYQLYGASLARVFVGVAGLHFYVSQFAMRDLLWLVPVENSLPTAGIPTLLFGSPARIGGAIFLGIIVSALFLVYGGRVLAVLHGLILIMFHERNPVILDGGDNFIEILLWFMPLLITNAYLSPQARKHRSDLEAFRGDSSPKFLIHNLGLFLIAFQISVVYTVAGLAKVVSPAWRQGIALYLVSRMDEFRYLTALTEATKNPFAVTFLSYSAVLVQLAFVPLILHRKTRAFGVINVALMHVGIILAMGLVGFGLSMFAGLSVVFPERLFHWARGRVRSYWRQIAASPRTPGEASAKNGEGLEPEVQPTTPSGVGQDREPGGY